MRFSLLSALVLTTAATPSLAVDLEQLGQQRKKTYCVAYVNFALHYARDTKQIDESQFSDKQKALFLKMYTKGDNYNYNKDFRQVEIAAQKILSEDPSVDEVLTRGAQCSDFLRLR